MCDLRVYDESIHTQHNPIPRYNAANPEQLPKLGIFIGLGGKSSGSRRHKILDPDWGLIHSYVLRNMDEVKPYIE